VTLSSRKRAQVVAEIRARTALMAIAGKRHRRRPVPRQAQPDTIRLSYFAALRHMIEDAHAQVVRAVRPRFAEMVSDFGPTKHDAAAAAAERADDGEHSGTYLALSVPPAAGELMAVPGGEPADGLHVTLFYAKGLTAEAAALVEERFREVWEEYRPIEVVVRRLGVFLGSSSSDWKDVLYARPESPKLLELRCAFIERLAEDGVAPASEHQFTPHITLKYLEPGEPRPGSIAPVRFEMSDHVFEAGDPAASLRTDAIDFNAFFDAIAGDFFSAWTNSRFAELARAIANRTATFQQEQVVRQWKAMFGVDVLKMEPWLASKVEAFTTESVSLIKSIPAKFFTQVESQVIRAAREGLRWEVLAETIEARTGVAEASAKLVARDQVGKFMGELNAARQQELGVSRFIWRTARDNRVRESHEELEGKVFAWNDPPIVDGEPSLPGEPINCRCQAEPVLADVVAEITGGPANEVMGGTETGDSAGWWRVDWNEEDIIRAPAGEPGGGQFAGSRHTEQNPLPELGAGVKAKLTKMKNKAAAAPPAEPPPDLVASSSTVPLTPEQTGEVRQPVMKEPAHWGQEETSVKQPPAEYGLQVPVNPVTGKPYQGEPTVGAPAAKEAAPAPTPKPTAPIPAKPSPTPSHATVVHPQGMNAAHKASHTKLVKAGKHEEAAAYLAKFTGAAHALPPTPGAFHVEHLEVTRGQVHTHLGTENPAHADQELKAATSAAFNAWQTSLSGKQSSIMSDYKGTGYQWMGNALRSNKVEAHHVAALSALTEALATAPETPRDFIVWRGVHYGKLAKDPIAFLNGKQGIIHDNSFVSTSFNVETAKSFSGSNSKDAVLYRIRVPAGTRVRYWTSEHELLKQRDAEFKIEHVYKTSDGFTVLDGSYIGSSPVPLSQRGAKHDARHDAVPGAGSEKFAWTEADFESGGVYIY
jgi:SPP1 gp7 family putative phage head morphogenesis protein